MIKKLENLRESLTSYDYKPISVNTSGLKWRWGGEGRKLALELKEYNERLAELQKVREQEIGKLKKNNKDMKEYKLMVENEKIQAIFFIDQISAEDKEQKEQTERLGRNFRTSPESDLVTNNAQSISEIERNRLESFEVPEIQSKTWVRKEPILRKS